MIAEVTAGCSSTNASARWTRETPASSARSVRASTASSLRAFSGKDGSCRPGCRSARSRSAATPHLGDSVPTASHRPAGSTAGPPRSAARRRAGPRAPPPAPGSSTAAARPPAGPAPARARRTGPRPAARARTSRCPIADLAGMHQVAERSEGLLDVGVDLGPVHLVEVDPVGLEPAQAVLDLTDDPAPGVAETVHVVAHPAVELGGEDDVVATALERLADDRLGLAVGVDVGGVDEVDAGVEGAADDPDAVGVVGVAVAAEHHGAEGQRADLEAGPAEGSVLAHAGVLSEVGWVVA